MTVLTFGTAKYHVDMGGGGGRSVDVKRGTGAPE